jgi:hypothetical protein
MIYSEEELMKRNMGLADRVIRLLVVLVVAFLIFTDVVTGGWAVALGVLAVVFLLTSLVAFCPLYFPFKISTVKKNDK